MNLPKATPDAAAGLADEVRQAILRCADVKRQFAHDVAGDVALAALITAQALGNECKVLLCGNGGSAAEAQHICAEFVGRFRLERPALAAIALTTDTSILTSVGNDYGFDEVFARQIEGLGQPGDVLFAYSTSGNSPNVLKAIEEAHLRRMRCIGFTGRDGGAMADLCEVCIRAPADDTPTVQECHTTAGHTICAIVERLVCTSNEPDAASPE